MVKELYQIHTREITLNITNGEVESVRKKNIVKSGCRVYENGCIGVAGTLGEPAEAAWENAKDALSLNIHHPGPAKDLVRSRVTGEMPEEREFITWTEEILATLKKEFPGTSCPTRSRPEKRL